MSISVIAQMTKAHVMEWMRDRTALLLTLAMPFVITAILGFALKGAFAGAPVPEFRVSVFNADAGAYGRELVAVLSQQRGQISVHPAPSAQAAKEDALDGASAVAVVIPKSFSARIEASKTSVVDVESDASATLKADIVSAIVNEFGKSTGAIVYLAAHHAVVTHGGPLPLHLQIQPSGLRQITSGSYYADGMMVMFLLIFGLSRGGMLQRERRSDRFKRMMASPVSRASLAWAYFISYWATLAVLATSYLVGFRVLLGTSFGSWTQTITLIAAYTAALAGLSLFLGSWISNESALNMITNIGSQIMAGIGGSIFPIYGMPTVVLWIAKALPNGQAMNALVNVLSGVTTSELSVPISYLLCLGVIAALLGGLRLFRIDDTGSGAAALRRRLRV